MKTFKLIDAWVSVILIISFCAMACVNQNNMYVLGYFIVGGWQVISMIAHGLGNWFVEKRSTRSAYHWIVSILLAVWALSIVYFPVFFCICYVMMVAGPLMAIFYTTLCFREIRAMNRRPLALLK